LLDTTAIRGRIQAVAPRTSALLDDALRLPPAEREALGLALLDSVHGPADPGDVEAAWAEEIHRRLEDLRAGRSTGRPWLDVERDLRASLKHR
jgi:putative addiction module component (TIGR02574 family)